MSGWIKLEKDRRDDPRVLRMARELRHAGVTHERFTQNAQVTLVLGCLDVLWCYADTHIREDDTLDLGVDEIDELVGVKGFCRLLPADWLEILDTDRVKLPDFHAHNGTESKRKALSQKRSERYRNGIALQEVTESSRKSVTPASLDQDQDQDQDQKKKKGDDKKLPATIPKGLDLEAWNRYIAYRKDAKFATLKRMSILFGQKALAGMGADQAAVVDQSIRNGWQGLFPLKQNGAANGPHQQGTTASERSRKLLEQWAENRGVDPATI